MIQNKRFCGFDMYFDSVFRHRDRFHLNAVYNHVNADKVILVGFN